LPEVEQALAEHLGTCEDFQVDSNLASLIHRYGSPNIENSVVEQLDPQVGKLACAV
jgi:hypothetical protein